jgi:hypothetical protein
VTMKSGFFLNVWQISARFLKSWIFISQPSFGNTSHYFLSTPHFIMFISLLMFPGHNLLAIIILPMYASCAVHPILLDLITLNNISKRISIKGLKIS